MALRALLFDRGPPAGASAAAAAQVGASHISDIFLFYSVIGTVDIFFFAPEAYLSSRAPCHALRSLAVSLAAVGMVWRLEWLALAWLRKPSTSFKNTVRQDVEAPNK